MYRVATDRAASYAYLIMIGSRLDGRNLPQVSQHLIEQPVDAQILYAEKSDLLPKAPLERVRAWYVQVRLPVP